MQMPNPNPLTAVLVDSAGVRRITVATELGERVTPSAFMWLDLVGGDDSSRLEFLKQLGVGGEDLTSMLRFGQTGRMSIRQRTLRAVTWLAESGGGLREVHVLASDRWVLTIWDGDVAALDAARQHFAEASNHLETSSFLAAAILLQLLLATMDEAIGSMDSRLYEIEEKTAESPASVELADLRKQLSRRQPTWARFERYSSSVRSAVVGVETLPGIDARGATELNDYADQVEDVEHRFHERIQWASAVMHNYAAELGQRQGQQISRLTVVSLIFLPITFLTGFFGMNFDWMVARLGSSAAFGALGILLPAMSATITILWLKHRRLL
jgi:Mg2+ and Co2+ transporter CorA